MTTDIIEADKERIDAFIKGVEVLSALLTTLNPAVIGEALTNDKMDRQLKSYMDHRKQWGKIFTEIADDLEKQWARLQKEKQSTHELIHLAKQSIAVFNGKEFKESADQIERFVCLMERLKTLRDSGFINEVMNTIRM